MSKNNHHITVFEHQSIKLNQVITGVKFDEDKLNALQKYFGDKGVPYYNLIHNGVSFNEHVGVIQVGKILIEVLPKTEKNETDIGKWRNILIDMVKAVGSFTVKDTSSSNLRIKTNTILDLYFEMYVKEIEYLLHTGLIKKYRKKEGNVTALKGSLQFSKHIQYNLTHQERFYVRHTTYDVEHTLHFILYKALKLLQQINTNTALYGRIGALLLHFPEMQDIKVNEATFEKLIYNRKNQHYQKAIEIAKLLLLQYHPDVSKGRNHVLALMFDMNLLWEQFIYVSLRKNKTDFTKVKPQSSKYFWKRENGGRTSIKPDIYIETTIPVKKIVLDTKWKNLNGYNPSLDDLRQMYVYHEYFNAEKVALIYPGDNKNDEKGTYFDKDGVNDYNKQCSVVLINVDENIKVWQTKITEQIKKFIKE